MVGEAIAGLGAIKTAFDMAKSRRKIEDEIPARQKFKASCTAIISSICIAAVVSLAEGEALQAHKEEIKKIAERMLTEIYGSK